MNDPATIFGKIDEQTDVEALAKAKAEIAAGKGVSHAKVRTWLLKLRAGKVRPPL